MTNNNSSADTRQGAAQVAESAQAPWLDPIPAGRGGDGSYLKAGFLNINSIRPRLDNLRLFLAENPSYHFFGIAESWLGPIVDDSLIRIKGYSVIRQDRNTNGGGIVLYVRDDFKITKLASSSTLGCGRPEIPEYLFCHVQQGDSSPILVGVIYRPHILPCRRTPIFLMFCVVFPVIIATNSSWGIWMLICRRQLMRIHSLHCKPRSRCKWICEVLMRVCVLVVWLTSAA